MLTIKVPPGEFYKESTGAFIQLPEQTLQMEHSLISISKWESKWHKPFFDGKDKTRAETLDYYKCMTITQNVNPLTWSNLSRENEEEIMKYIQDPMTGTTFNERNKHGRGGHQVISSEVLYWEMIELGIPFECEKWHLNRLLTLIDVCSIKSQPPKKMSQRALMLRNASLNAARRKALHSKG